jgi:hypothetical protein
MSDMVAKLDDLGRPAWIALMVLGFILFWPIGLATLAFLIWSGRMGCGHTSWRGERGSGWGIRDKMDRWQGQGERRQYAAGFAPTGNRAFDEYRDQTLKRLEEEFAEFKSFLDRLRVAKDKAEFEQFMTERRNKPNDPPATQP